MGNEPFILLPCWLFQPFQNGKNIQLKDPCITLTSCHKNSSRKVPVSTKLSQIVCDYTISDEFDFGCNQTRTL